MTTPDIAAQCKRLRAALEGVSEGPWFLHDFREASDNPCVSDITVSCDHPATITVANMANALTGKDAEALANAAFIALSREAVPALLDTIERHAAEIERLREEMAGMETRLRRWEPRSSTDFSQILTGSSVRASLTGEDA
jgi:hypothetical protein